MINNQYFNFCFSLFCFGFGFVIGNFCICFFDFFGFDFVLFFNINLFWFWKKKMLLKKRPFAMGELWVRSEEDKFYERNFLENYNRRRQWHPTPVLLPGKFHGQRSLVGCSPWGRYESDTTEWLPFHFSLSCIGEGNGNPLQYSCLENPRDGGAWWAAISGVAQSRTWLKRLSSSSIEMNGHGLSLYRLKRRAITTFLKFNLKF